MNISKSNLIKISALALMVSASAGSFAERAESAFDGDLNAPDYKSMTAEDLHSAFAAQVILPTTSRMYSKVDMGLSEYGISIDQVKAYIATCGMENMLANASNQDFEILHFTMAANREQPKLAMNAVIDTYGRQAVNDANKQFGEALFGCVDQTVDYIKQLKDDYIATHAEIDQAKAAQGLELVKAERIKAEQNLARLINFNITIQEKMVALVTGMNIEESKTALYHEINELREREAVLTKLAIAEGSELSADKTKKLIDYIEFLRNMNARGQENE